ncbi:MAG TPA: restriction endonuclease [Trebonia sp.]
MSVPLSVKTIDPCAYNALAEALSVVFWFKRPLERLLRSALRQTPEILAALDFNAPKRETAGLLVELLMADEARYQEVTIALMLTVGRMDTFPDFARHEDADRLVAQAQAAVADVQRWTDRHQEILTAHEEYARTIATEAESAKRNRGFSEALAALKMQFLGLQGMVDPHARGRALEAFLNELFRLFDLDPRAAYSLEREQIDGAFSFDTDDYVLEAKWWKTTMSRESLDVFAAKVRRKGKNALGLYVAINGFSSDALDEYASCTPFTTMDGMDLVAVLDERVRLDDLLRRKKRHMNETGSCYFPVSQMV